MERFRPISVEAEAGAHRMRRALQLTVMVCALVATAHASEQSELLYSRGLVEFHAAKYTEALQLFDQAVAADADDPYARYYRGVTQGRLGNFQAAADDLRAVMRAKPDVDQGALELGAALVQIDRAREAIPWLEQA